MRCMVTSNWKVLGTNLQGCTPLCTMFAWIASPATRAFCELAQKCFPNPWITCIKSKKNITLQYHSVFMDKKTSRFPGARTKIRCRKASVKSLRRTSQRHHQRTELNLKPGWRKFGFWGGKGPKFRGVFPRIFDPFGWLTQIFSWVL